MSEAAEAAAAEAEEKTEEKKDVAEAGGAEQAGESAGIPPKVDHVKRFFAMLVDSIIAGVAAGVIGVVGGIIGGMIFGPLGGLISAVGWVAGGAYILVRDSLNDGRSFGKKALKLHVQTPSGAPCTQEESIERNKLLAVPYAVGALQAFAISIPVVGLLLVIPLWFLSLAANLVPLYEAVHVVGLDKNGRRPFELRARCFTVPE